MDSPRVEIGLQDTADEVAGQRGAVGVLEQPPQWFDESGSDHLRGTHTIEHERAALRHLQGFRQQLSVVEDLDTFVAELLGERIMLLAGLLGPHHVVEEELFDVVSGFEALTTKG